MSLYVLAYDIAKDSRRKKAAKIALRYGTRVQESVFEIECSPDDLKKLRESLCFILTRFDTLAIYPIDERPDRSPTYWQAPPPPTPDVYIL